MGLTPKDMVIGLLSQNQNANNPLFQNLLQMANNGDAKGLEGIARNMMAEKGLDYDTEFAKFRQQYRL